VRAPEADDPLDRDVALRLASADLGGAVAAVLRALGPGLTGYLSALLRDDDDVREVLADVAEHLLTSLPRFRGECRVKTWTYRIAWRTAMRHRHDPRRQRTTSLRSSLADALAAEVPRSTGAFRRDAAIAWLERVRAELSPADQSLLTLRLDRGMSWAEVAVGMGSGDTAADLAALRKRYERIKDRLRKAAERDGVVV
jgi:RNA polymerase sigma-70 factor (ECF subfamily)